MPPTRRRLRQHRPTTGFVLAALLVAGLAGGTLAGCTKARSDPGISVSRGVCGQEWHPAHGGQQSIRLHNSGTETMEVWLIDPATGGVYAEVEAMGPGTVRTMRVQLGRGSYALRCIADGSDAITGPTVRITDGPEHGASAVLPVTEQDLTGAVRQYRDYVGTGLATLATEVDALRRVVATGDLTGSRAAWLTAHLTYERLGAAYDSFGDFGDAIDGVPDGLPAGVADPDFTGFRRIEYELWHGDPLGTVAGTVDQLASDVAGLRADFPTEQTDPNDLPLRAHEILENALQFELTGAADQGSGSGLATVDANLDGTQAVLDALAPVMSTRYTGWSGVAPALAGTRSLVEAQRHPDGGWTSPGALDPAARRGIDGSLGQLLEILAPIAAIGDVRRTS